MYSSQFDDNPFAEEMEAEVTPPLASSSGEEASTRAKRQREESPPEDELGGRITPSDGAPAEQKGTGVPEETVPYIGYSVEDAEEGDGEDDADEAYTALLCRVAEMEATQRESMRAHRFCIMLAKQEKEVLRACMGRLRASLVDLQQRRAKGGQGPTTAVAVGGSDKESGIQVGGDPSELVRLLDAYDGVTRVKRLAARVHHLQRLKKMRDGSVEGGDRNFTASGDTWMPSPTLFKQDVAPHEPCMTTRWRFDRVQSALEGLLPVLNDHMRKVVTVFVDEIRRLSERYDTLREVKDSIVSSVHTLDSRWKAYVSWATERSLLVSEEQMRSHLSALQFTSTEQQILHQQQQLRKRLHRAEVAVGSLLSVAAGMQLPKVSPPVLQATMRRHEELEQLRDQLTRELLYLRQMMRDRLTTSSMHVFSRELCDFKRFSLEEGRSGLLQRSCASLAQQLSGLNEQIISMVLRGSTACPPLAQQAEQLCLYEVKACTQHASIVAFLAENTRLQQQINDATSIKLVASPGNAAVLLLEEKLQAPVGFRQAVEHGGGEDCEEEEEEDHHHHHQQQHNDNKNDDDDGDGEEGEGGGEELDAQRLLADTFTKGIDALLNSLNIHLRGVEELFRSERQICREIAFLLRMTVAGDRLVQGKVGVSSPANAAEDSLRALEEACVCFEQPQRILQRLPSLDALHESLYTLSSRHASVLAEESGAAAIKWAELREDVEWCRQQCPKTSASELREARKELQQLKTSLAVAVTRERDPAPLEAELLRNKAKLSQLRHDLHALQEELAVAEEEWRLVAAKQGEEHGQEEEEEEEEEEAVADDGVWATPVAMPQEEDTGDSGSASQTRAAERESDEASLDKQA